MTSLLALAYGKPADIQDQTVSNFYVRPYLPRRPVGYFRELAVAGGLDIQHLVPRVVLSHHHLSVSVQPGTLSRKV